MSEQAARATLRAAIAGGDHTPATLLAVARAEAACGAFDAADALLCDLTDSCPGWDAPPRVRMALAVEGARAGRHAAAAAVLRDLRARGDESAGLLGNLAACEVSLGLQAEAVATARRAVATAPNDWRAWRTLLGVLPYDAATDPREVVRAARTLGRLTPRWDLSPPPAQAPGTPLRVGLLSDGFGAHPAGWLSVAALAALDPAEFALHCFAGRRMADPIAARFQEIAAGWHDVAGLDDEQVAARIRAARIDVLIDLGGWGDRGRIAVCAHRAAPVQVKWVGNLSHPTGLAEIDLLIADRRQIPAQEEADYTERLALMPDSYICYQPPDDAPEVAPAPWTRTGHITFGCFNNLAKVTPYAIATWAEVMSRVRHSRMVLRAAALDDADARARVLDGFARAGIAAERIALHGLSPHRALLAGYGEIDVALDPMPYAGCLTTCEALWMGVPTVSLAGHGFYARHGLSVLTAVGLSDWAARTRAGYVARALRAVQDPPALARLRAGLRAQVAASPLCDAPRFARAVADVLMRAVDAAPPTAAPPPSPART